MADKEIAHTQFIIGEALLPGRITPSRNKPLGSEFSLYLAWRAGEKTEEDRTYNFSLFCFTLSHLQNDTSQRDGSQFSNLDPTANYPHTILGKPAASPCQLNRMESANEGFPNGQMQKYCFMGLVLKGILPTKFNGSEIVLQRLHDSGRDVHSCEQLLHHKKKKKFQCVFFFKSRDCRATLHADGLLTLLSMKATPKSCRANS